MTRDSGSIMIIVFELRFTYLCLSSRWTIYGPDDVASSTPQQ